MTDVEMWLEVLQTVGVPSIALAGAGFFIYKNQIWAAEERAQFMSRDEESDARVFSMLEKQNELDSYFINFSDGQPYCSGHGIYYGGSSAQIHTRDQIKKMQNF